LLLAPFACTQPPAVSVKKTGKGFVLETNAKPLFINGMNWDYHPIGTKQAYNLWSQPDDFIKSALAYEMKLLQDMGVHTIRQYIGVPVKWVNYIYDHYGIYTVLNRAFGCYGLMLNDKWEANIDYSSPLVKAELMKQVTDIAVEFKGARGLLMFLLGNENSYGLFWQGADTENVPSEYEKSTIAAGLGKAGNSIGPFTFQFSDGWRKSGQTVRLGQHDTTASWENDGYQNDFKKQQII